MLEHRDEIYARPKRTWFMTEKEKKLVAQAEKVFFLFPELVVVEIHLSELSWILSIHRILQGTLLEAN